MAALRPVQIYGLAVPPGEWPVPAIRDGEYPATFRVTMAAIDPALKPEEFAPTNGSTFTGSTLRLIRLPNDDSSDDDDDEEDEEFDMSKLLNGELSDEDDDEEMSDEEEANGGPSDPSRSPKAKYSKLMDALNDDDAEDSEELESDDEIERKLTAKEKGKGKAIEVEDMDDSDDEEDMDETEVNELVLCTLDPSKQYQQTLDITINEHETVYFQASGTHVVYLTGNILIPEDLPDDGLFDADDDDDGEYDLPPDEDELDLPDVEDESDELDDIEDPRIEEVDSEDGEAVVQKLIKPTDASKKGNNKRAHEESDEEAKPVPTIDSLLNKSLKPVGNPAEGVNGEAKLSKSQLKKMRKKMKDNAGNAVETATTTETAATTAGKEDLGVKQETVEVAKASPGKPDKKVQFAQTLVQGPTNSSASNAKASDAPKINGEKPSLGVKVVQGVSVDDKKFGQGPVAKKGDKVSMRYIGKLEKDKKVFDSNKKGKPFTFQLGASQVIKGWELGVQGMSVGGERRITIPPHLAYGSKSMPEIPANSTLVFDLKLLDIK